MKPSVALIGGWLVAAMFSGVSLAAGDKSAVTEKSTYEKAVEIQQKNREILQKTVDDTLNSAPGSGRQEKPLKKTGDALAKAETRTIEQPKSPPALQFTQQGRDPFTTSDGMYQEMGRQSVSGPGRGFIPSLGMDNVPKMKLRGYINDNPKRGATALLEVEGAGIFLVKAGDEIGLQAIGRNQVLKVIKVDAQRVEVQAGQINQVIIVR